MGRQQTSSEYDAWFRREVQKGLDSANAGDLIPAADVEARFAAKREATWQRIEAEQLVDGAGYDAWFRREVEAGMVEANAGKLIPAADVEAEAAAWRAATLRKLADE